VSVSTRIRFADCELDMATFELRRDGQRQAVEPQVFDLLVYLARHPDRLISKDELIEKVWGGRAVSDAALSSRIKSARRAIGDDGDQQRLIRTVHGRGFRFVGDILGESQPATVQVPGRWPALRRRLGTVPPTALATAVGLFVVSVALIIMITSRAPAPPMSIAVLPFASSPGEGEVARQAEMLVDAITTRLSQRADLFVISRATTSVYRGNGAEPRAVGRDLNVRYVISGSAHRLADDIQVDVQLVDVGQGGELWAARQAYPQAEQALALDRLAYRLTQAMEVKLLATESRRSRQEHRDNPSAADLTTRGFDLLNRRMTAELNQQALALFEAALVQDPNSVSALLGLARSNLNLAINQWVPQSERGARLDRADEAVRRAITLAPNVSFAQRIRGGILRAGGDTEQAIAAFARAIELDPNDAAAHAEIGRTKIDVGLAGETIAHIEQAVRINPEDRDVAFWYFWAVQAAVHVGDGETAIAWLRKAIEASPNYTNPLPWLPVAYVFAGRHDDARRCMEQLERIRPGMTISGWDAAYRRRNPVVVAQLERTYAALRLLGVPE
jgi:DNA-binding winged helix-turn-helix (wHTH) protein/TolB-like protein/Flp pilus assembly protein TadD